MNVWTFVTLVVTFFIIFLLLLYSDKFKGCSRVFRIGKKSQRREEPEDYGFKL